MISSSSSSSIINESDELIDINRRLELIKHKFPNNFDSYREKVYKQNNMLSNIENKLLDIIKPYILKKNLIRHKYLKLSNPYLNYLSGTDESPVAKIILLTENELINSQIQYERNFEFIINYYYMEFSKLDNYDRNRYSSLLSVSPESKYFLELNAPNGIDAMTIIFARKFPAECKKFSYYAFYLLLYIIYLFYKEQSYDLDTFVVTLDHSSLSKYHKEHILPESMCYLCLYISAGFKFDKNQSLTYGYFKDIVPILESKLGITNRGKLDL